MFLRLTRTVGLAVYLTIPLLGLTAFSNAATIPSDSQQVLGQDQCQTDCDHHIQYDSLINANTSLVKITASRPFYAIAHRVLVKAGVDAAIKHGANALEIDFQAWWTDKDSPGWWADHDGTSTSWGDKAEDMFKHIAEKRQRGANIIFVWLDIKNPNACIPGDKKWHKCSVHHLQDLARQYLLPMGVRVLYGTNSDKEIEKGAYSKLASRGLDPAEAIDIDGNFEDVNRLFAKYGDMHSTPVRQRVMSKGLFNWSLKPETILGELKKASASGKFGRLFGWTAINHAPDSSMIKRLIIEAHGDGLIYGGILHYQDGPLSEAPIERIKKVINSTNDVHFAQVSEKEWPW